MAHKEIDVYDEEFFGEIPISNNSNNKTRLYPTENIKDGDIPQSPHINNQEIQTRPNSNRRHKFLNRPRVDQ